MTQSPGGAATAWRRALIVCVAAVVADQVTKAIVRGALDHGDQADLVLGFHLVRAENTGLAFGTLSSGGFVVLAVTIAALAGVIVWFAREPGRPGLWLGAGLLAGGAVGNMIDRIRLDAVTDFIEPPLWPAFNVADVCITAGALALVWISFQDDEAGRATGNGGEPSATGSIRD